MTYEIARANILARSTIRFGSDRKGRRFAQYFDMRAGRWVRCGVAEAEVAAAGQAAQ